MEKLSEIVLIFYHFCNLVVKNIHLEFFFLSEKCWGACVDSETDL